MSVSPSIIKTIYLYVFSGVGLALILFGSYTGIQYGVNVTQFDKYPLQQWEEGQCRYPNIVSPAKPVMEEGSATPSAEEIEKQEKQCEENQERQRKIKQTQDLTHAIAMLFLGILVFVPHWTLARKS
ncbi:MAG: Uncharacterized protein G01um10145_641 [Microgenomates group bacterium Gr01-1014_5]|nr:MAG: Uncharacterized protein G01um10145_641 [Microgenomates group bacterium Gr01-1014_5]